MLLRPLSSFRFTGELFAYGQNLFSLFKLRFFNINIARKKKAETPETITTQGVSKNTHGHHSSHQSSTYMIPKLGKLNTKLAIVKGLGWKHIGPGRKRPRKTTFFIWGYDYRFVRGQKWYI